MRTKRLGIDIGGTFTDLALFDAVTGTVERHKVLTTPTDPARAVLRGIDELMTDTGTERAQISEVIYATTVATNAVLQRKGPRTALVTTAGFRDVLLIQRQARYDLFDLFVDKPAPLLRRREIHEVRERLRADGTELTPLDEEQLRALATQLQSDGVESVAIVFLHSYRNDAHERRAAQIVRDVAPRCHVSVSAAIAPVIGEYERTNTTVVDAYVRPGTTEHLRRLSDELRASGVDGELRVMLSDGGVTSVERACTNPVRMIESGPAAGAKMGAFVGATVGERNVIAFDMGGTTAKVALIEDGRPTLGDQLEIDRVGLIPGSGLPLAIPSIDLIEIGSGGGSIARVQGAILRIGPESAGANPGPACYAQGGTEPTVTDADLVLGYITPGYFLGGRLELDETGARDALKRGVGGPLGLSVVDAARGIYEVVNANMAAAIRAGTIQRGRDPRRYTMVATGGAGPMHAVALARSLGVPRVVCPALSGVASAVGLLMAEHGTTFVRASLADVDDGFAVRAEAEFGSLAAEARPLFAQDLAEERALTLRRSLGVRFRGQGYDLKIDAGEDGDPIVVADLAARFHAEYERLYGPTEPAPIEATTWHLEAIIAQPVTAGPKPLAHRTPSVGTPHARRTIYDAARADWAEAGVWRFEDLAGGTTIDGPGVLEQAEATIVFFTGDTAVVDALGNVVVSVAENLTLSLVSGATEDRHADVAE
jgi:N-methylhydantoinase A/oxoprolinase/acetone carboxylase beta subunit